MTKEQMLASLEAQIRKDIPRLMELREGCIIKHNRFDWIRKIVYKKETTLITIDAPHQDKEVFSYKYKNDFAEEEYTIIGHDIMLNDVLEWLEYMRKHHDLCDYIRCDVSDKIFQIVVVCEIADVLSLHGFKEECKILKWDLSKLYLKDQSEELIKFLHNLIKE